MDKKFIRIYAVFAIIILVGTVTIFAHLIYKDTKIELADAEKNFKYIAQIIANPSHDIKPLDTQHVKIIKNLCYKAGNIENAMLSESKNQIIFSWSKGSNKLYYDKHNNIILSGNSLFTKPYSTGITVEKDNKTKENLVFSAGLNMLSNELIFRRSRDAFFILTGLLLFTLILIIINAIINSDTKVYAQIDNTVENAEYQDNCRMTHQEPSKQKKHTEHVNWSDLDNLNIYKTNQTNSQNYGAYVNDHVHEIEPTELTPIEDDDTIHAEKIDSLYSNSTGICREIYLNEKLEAELGRAASSEQDLSIIILKVQNLQHIDALAKKISEELLSEFKFKDMLFELSTDSFAIILHSTNLNTCMKASQDLLKNIKKIANTYGYTNKIAIGITTRMARLIPATRILDEAISAVEKAYLNNDDPIVAFRADPELYRKFIVDYT